MERDKSRPVKIREWATFGFASFAVLLSLFNLYQSHRDRARAELDRGRTELVAANQILNEAWDVLGGEPFTETISEFTKDPKQLEKARRLLARAMVLYPELSKVHRRWGSYHVAKGELDTALFCHNKAVQLDPQDAAAHNNRGIVLRALERYEEALAAYDQALRLDPEYVLAHNNRGAALRALGRIAEANSAFARARELRGN